MRAHFIFVALFVVAGVTTAFLLVPRDKELALMFFKDKDFEAALQVYEDQLANGDWTINVVVPLTQLYLQYGDVDSAAGLMEEFVRKNPDNLEARRLLGRYFQFAQRPADYLRNLEESIDIALSETELRELSSIYNFNAQFRRQIDVLELLIRHFPNNPDDFLTLAQLQASLSDFEGAVNTLDRMLDSHPSAMTADVTELHVSLLLDRARYDQAFAQAGDWLTAFPEPKTFARYASLFSFKGRGDMALDLVAPMVPEIERYPELLAEYVRLQAENGQSEAAFARLNRMHAENRLPDEAAGTFIDLALDRNEKDMALDAAKRIDLRILPDWMLPVLAEVAISIDRLDFVRGMLSGLGTAFLELRPVLAAEVSLAMDDKPGARHWVGEAEAAPSLTIVQKTNLARVLLKLDEPGKALALLREIAFEPSAPPSIYSDLARLFIQLGKTAEGLVDFKKIREARQEYLIDAGWAILATSTGDTAAVIEWLDESQDDAQRQTLLDIYFAANRYGHQLLALIAAERLYERTDRPSDRIRLTRAAIDAAKTGGPLATVRTALLGTYAATEIAAESGKIAELGYANLATVFAAGQTASLPGVQDTTVDPDTGAASADDETEGPSLSALRVGFDTRGGKLAYVAGLMHLLDTKQALGRFLAEKNAAKLAQGYLDGDALRTAIDEIIGWQAFDLAWPYVAENAAGRLNNAFYQLIAFAERPDFVDRVIDFLNRELDRRDLKRSVHEARLNALTEIAGLGAALPHFETFANLYGIEWAYSNVDGLKSLKQDERVPEFWEAFARGPRGTPAVKRIAVFNLLEHGRKAPAVDLLLELSANAGPDSDDVAQLLYVWGPRPRPEEMDWIETRARSAPSDEMRQWFRILRERGGSARIVRLGKATMSRPAADPERIAIAPVYLRALLENGEKAEGEELLAELIESAEEPKQLLDYADTAFANGFVELAQTAYDQLATSADPSLHILQRHATSAYFNDDRQVALEAYLRYLNAAGPEIDPESHYYYGELLSGAGSKTQALEHFRVALDGSAEWQEPNAEQRFIHARLLQLTGRIEAAKDAFRGLLSDRPDRDGVRAELVALLLQDGALEEARLVMSQRPETE